MLSRKVSTVRREHGIYGDGRLRSINNKSKGSKSQSHLDFKIATLAGSRRDHSVIFVVKHSVLVAFSMAGVGMCF